MRVQLVKRLVMLRCGRGVAGWRHLESQCSLGGSADRLLDLYAEVLAG